MKIDSTNAHPTTPGVAVVPPETLDQVKRACVALNRCGWNEFPYSTDGQLHGEPFHRWADIVRSPEYLRRWVERAWLPAAAEVAVLLSMAKDGIRGEKLALALGPIPQSPVVREAAQLAEKHFLMLVAEEDRPRLAESIARDLAERLNAARAAESQGPRPEPEILHRYFDYVSSQLMDQATSPRRARTRPTKKRRGRGREDSDADRDIDEMVAQNGHMAPTSKQVQEKRNCSPKHAETCIRRARERYRSAGDPLKPRQQSGKQSWPAKKAPSNDGGKSR